MLKLINEIFVLTFTIVLMICILQYLKSTPENRNSFFHQAGVLLSYGYWKLRITVSYALEALKKNTLYAFTSYQPNETRIQTLLQQQRHLEHLENQMKSHGKAYGKKTYNLKILNH